MCRVCQMKLRTFSTGSHFKVSFDKLDIFDRLLSKKFQSTRMKIKKVLSIDLRLESNVEVEVPSAKETNGLSVKQF